MATDSKMPNAEQLDALAIFIARHGTITWKRLLTDMWIVGADINEPQGHLLRQVRNQFGPKWLNSVNTQDIM